MTTDVGIPNDGTATILNAGQEVDGQPMVARQELTIQFDQVIPKPFCTSGGPDFILVQGPVHLRQIVVLAPSGDFRSNFHARGPLNVTPVNPLTSPPTPPGETYEARVVEHHRGVVTDEVTLAASFQLQAELPPASPLRGPLIARLQVGPGESNHHSLDLDCGQ